MSKISHFKCLFLRKFGFRWFYQWNVPKSECIHSLLRFSIYIFWCVRMILFTRKMQIVIFEINNWRECIVDQYRIIVCKYQKFSRGLTIYLWMLLLYFDLTCIWIFRSLSTSHIVHFSLHNYNCMLYECMMVTGQGCKTQRTLVLKNEIVKFCYHGTTYENANEQNKEQFRSLVGSLQMDRVFQHWWWYSQSPDGMFVFSGFYEFDCDT